VTKQILPVAIILKYKHSTGSTAFFQLFFHLIFLLICIRSLKLIYTDMSVMSVPVLI